MGKSWGVQSPDGKLIQAGAGSNKHYVVNEAYAADKKMRRACKAWSKPPVSLGYYDLLKVARVNGYRLVEVVLRKKTRP